MFQRNFDYRLRGPSERHLKNRIRARSSTAKRQSLKEQKQLLKSTVMANVVMENGAVEARSARGGQGRDAGRYVPRTMFYDASVANHFTIEDGSEEDGEIERKNVRGDVEESVGFSNVEQLQPTSNLDNFQSCDGSICTPGV